MHYRYNVPIIIDKKRYAKGYLIIAESQATSQYNVDKEKERKRGRKRDRTKSSLTCVVDRLDPPSPQST